MGIYKKLLKIQQEIENLSKDSKSFTYTYVSGSKVLEAVRPRMNELGLLLKQEILEIENERQDYQSKNGSKSEILSKVMMRFTWIDTETGEKDENLFGANGQNDWEKGLGSALTYAERYFLLKYFHIPTDEDDIDNSARKPHGEAAPMQTNQKASKPEKTIWLNENDENWKKIAKRIESGGTVTMKNIRKDMGLGVSKKIEERLKELFNIQ